MLGGFQFPSVLNSSTGYFSQSKYIHWLISVLASIVMCKIVYEVTGLVSLLFFRAYSKLNKAQKIEWNNRGFSTFHALLVTFASLYLLLSDDFYDDSQEVSIIYRQSTLSDTILGISIGYFLLDLGMILWNFPALGGLEYVLHHGLSLFPIFLSLVSGQGQFYILLVLFTESTTPFVNLRWYLDVSGQKSSRFYFCNGILLFLGWLVARILLFIFLLIHVYLHFDQVLVWSRKFFRWASTPCFWCLLCWQ
ncbi:TLC domain-containing protein 4-B isoform X2 [Telopea speciosissima]|uniref:TLC domain-containing protein 4-B isoform X2 n=1 Tax=Telopea speciosissima TaxID=54955 RepID=UPI001CC6D2A3|nr:TLC domain-containing protein 4-B isoform X2 [Telopea speciosissima]